MLISSSQRAIGAIFISLIPFNDKMRKNIEYIDKRNRGFSFQEAQLTYNLPLDFFVLPYSWFDGDWVDFPGGGLFLNFFLEKPPLRRKVVSFINSLRKRIVSFVTPHEFYGFPNYFETPIQSLNDFHKGAFCYHWHNQWNVPIEKHSAFYNLRIDLNKKLGSS
jgi:hypothetical protein